MSKKKKSTLYVSGMHCASCEVLIEKKLKAMNGVHDVSASLADKKVICTLDQHAPSVKTLNREFADLGYSFSETDMDTATFSLQSVMTAILVGIVMIVLFLIFQDSGILASAVVDTNSSIGAFFILGIVASLSTCAALVGGLLLSLSKQWNSLYGGDNDKERIKPFLMFNLGRLISYALLGSVLGIIGSVFTISLQFTSLLVLVVSLIMVLLGLQMLGVPWAKKIRLTAPRFVSSYISDEQNFQGKYMPFLVGALTFFYSLWIYVDGADCRTYDR
jgi:cation transport ATPase